MKQKKSGLFTVICVVAAIALGVLLSVVTKDKPPKLALGGTELDLSNLRISDLNAPFQQPDALRQMRSL